MARRLRKALECGYEVQGRGRKATVAQIGDGNRVDALLLAAELGRLRARGRVVSTAPTQQGLPGAPLNTASPTSSGATRRQHGPRCIGLWMPRLCVERAWMCVRDTLT